MTIDITDRYKLIIEEHHYATDFRAKIIQAWCLFYGALAAGLGWTQATVDAHPVSWVFCALASLVTVFMWAADFRHRAALANSKRIGEAIEKSAEIPNGQRFFASIKSGWLTHSLVIDLFAGLMLGVLSRSAVFLKGNGGDLKSLPPDMICWAIGGGAFGVALYLSVDLSLARKRLRELPEDQGSTKASHSGD
jgi:hypothetical protein